MTRIGVVIFPGSNGDADALHAIELAGAEPVPLWHESATLDGVAAVILPGGFAYGDYLRAGVIARFSPVMRAVSAFAGEGGLVLGICNGFQVLAEAGLVPGALLRNRALRFLGRDVLIVPERLDTPFTRAITGRRPLRMPIAHGEGCYFADEATLDGLERDGRHPGVPTRAGPAAISRSAAASTNEQMITRPASLPRTDSAARSGWGIRPATLPAGLSTPAMARSDPFGFERSSPAAARPPS